MLKQPKLGTIYYDTDEQVYYVWNGTTWVKIEDRVEDKSEDGV